MNKRIKNRKITLIALSIYQILGGLVGLYVTGIVLARTESIHGAILLIMLLAIVLFLFSIKSGKELLNTNSRKGFIYSIINQSLQIVSFAVGSYKYAISSGIKLNVGFDFTQEINFYFDFALVSEFNFVIKSSNLEYYLYINVVPIILLVVLWDIYTELFKNKNQKQDILLNSTESGEESITT